jgi:hypothetical protein
MKTTRLVLAAIAIAAQVSACAVPAGAQRSAEVTGRLLARPDSLVVSLLTIGPGEGLFDRFGHTAIRVRNVATGLDSAWNWGMYSFEDPDLVVRFLTSETRYWMAGFGTSLFVDFYRRAGRAVWEQELALDQPAADSLLRFMRWNAREENKYYRYDYYLDNCSTRARDAIDMALRGALKQSLAVAVPDSSITWRKETLRSSAAYPMVAFGMTFALGTPADAVVSPWEEGFLPARLRDRLRAVRLPDLNGTRPLVSAERELNPPGAIVDAAVAPSYVAPALIIGVLLHFLITLLGRAGQSRTAARVTLAVFGSLWHFTIGVAGTLVLLAALFTRHEFMDANTSVLLGTPVSLALAFLYGRGWAIGAGAGVRKAAIALSVIAGVAATLTLLMHFIPPISPADWAPALLVAPVHLALAHALIGFDRARAARVAA